MTPPPPRLIAGVVPTAEVQARIAHLFRAARRDGHIHPLQHLIERYRAEAGAAAAELTEPAPAPPAGARGSAP